MEPQHITLRLCLEALAASSQVRAACADLHHLIYLAQEVQSLGYSFVWSANGPYSEDLDDDLGEVDWLGQFPSVARRLNNVVSTRLEVLKKLLEVPPGFIGTQSQWLQLAASVHFLIREARYEGKDARARVVGAAMPELVPMMQMAEDRVCRLSSH